MTTRIPGGDPSEGTSDERCSPGERLLVRDRMSWPPVTATSTTTLAEALGGQWPV
jgi:hypothetical protein